MIAQGRERQRIDRTRWIGSSRIGSDQPAAPFVKKAFSHQGSGGVFDRQKKDIVHAIAVANRSGHKQYSTTQPTTGNSPLPKQAASQAISKNTDYIPTR
jgi:hypothetical protein